MASADAQRGRAEAHGLEADVADLLMGLLPALGNRFKS
jgi:hypothetical protein